MMDIEKEYSDFCETVNILYLDEANERGVKQFLADFAERVVKEQRELDFGSVAEDMPLITIINK